jgi:hypothetical protein
MSNHRARSCRLSVTLLAATFISTSSMAPDEAAAQAACVRPTATLMTLTGIVAGGNPLGGCARNTAWDAVVPFKLSAPASAGGHDPTDNTLATGTVRLMRSTDNLYVGFTVSQDLDLSDLDKVILVFDTNNDDQWGTGDFYVVIGLGPSTPIVSPTGGAHCQIAATVQEVWNYQAGADPKFVRDDNSALLTAIKAAVAYDYETATDPETNLWNVEIAIPLATSGLGSAFGMGTYLMLTRGALPGNGNVLRWPSQIDERNPDDFSLNLVPVDPAKLANASFLNNCIDVTFVAVSTPLTTEGSNGINKNASTNFKVWYNFVGPAITPSTTNSGKVRIVVYKMTATNPGIQQVWTQTNPEDINGTKQTWSAAFTMPPGGFADATDFCSDLYVETWNFDDNTDDASNHKHINHIPIASSEVTRDVDLGVEAIPGLAPGSATSLLIYFNTTNDPSSKALGARGRGHGGATGALLLLAGAAYLGAVATVRRGKGAALLLALAGTGAIVIGCREQVPVRIGTDRWEVVNAKELGLTPMPGEPGWYRMPAKRGEVKHATLRFTGRPLPYRTVTDSLPMAAADNGQFESRTVRVRPGQVVTVLAFGTVDVDGPDGPLAPTAPGGLIRKDESPRMESAYPLARSPYVPSQNVGALIGSFDGFKSSFVIGSMASIVVPKGAEQLTLAINGTPLDYRAAKGAFGLKWIVTDAPTVPTSSSYGFDTPTGEPLFIPPWEVLTATHMRTFYEVPVKRRGTGQTRIGRAALGEAHFSIYESHVQ